MVVVVVVVVVAAYRRQGENVFFKKGVEVREVNVGILVVVVVVVVVGKEGKLVVRTAGD